MGADLTRGSGPGLWARAVADVEFRDALIADPLRALAAADVEAPPELVRRLDELAPVEREDLMRELIREVASLRARQMWGDHFWTPDDGPGPPDSSR